MMDQMLAANPERTEKVAMAAVYFAWAKQLEDKKQWDAAAAAYSKAHGLDPQGKQANDALAAHYFMVGKALDAAGKDGGPDFRRAVALRPDYLPAKAAAHEAETRGRPVWMLYAAVLAAIGAAALFAVGMRRRRAA